MLIRPFATGDEDVVWDILRPVLRAGETYALPAEWTRDEALTYWAGPPHEVFVAQEDGAILGTYYLQPNLRGGGAHVANCGYMTAVGATGRGVASAMCVHSLEAATARGFESMQFNFVVATNTRAVALWRRYGFGIVGTLPRAFRHPTLGFVDALVMFRDL